MPSQSNPAVAPCPITQQWPVRSHHCHTRLQLRHPCGNNTLGKGQEQAHLINFWNCGGVLAMLPHSVCSNLVTPQQPDLGQSCIHCTSQTLLKINGMPQLAQVVSSPIWCFGACGPHITTLGSTEKGFRKKSMKKRLRKKIIGACILQLLVGVQTIGHRNLKSFSAKHH